MPLPAEKQTHSLTHKQEPGKESVREEKKCCELLNMAADVTSNLRHLHISITTSGSLAPAPPQQDELGAGEQKWDLVNPSPWKIPPHSLHLQTPSGRDFQESLAVTPPVLRGRTLDSAGH